MPFVYSTLSTNQIYMDYEPRRHENQIPTPNIGVLIKGGANVADSKTIITPLGMRTEITDAQLELLEKNEVFKTHVKHGFIKVENRKYDVEKAVKSMEKKDKSAPRVESDYAKGKAPKVTGLTSGEPVDKLL